jgi:CheY-like chemotaxis protein/HPt (histidine-containing phosphotransfer) domain-containing protein
MRVSGLTLLGVIDDVVDLSRIEAGRLVIVNGPFAPADMLEALCESLVPLAEAHHVDLSLYLDPGIPACVVGDVLRVRQLLYNLLATAIRFSGGQRGLRGMVMLRVTVAGSDPWQLRFEVACNGIGLTPEAVGCLLQPFSEADIGRGLDPGSAGPGLSICKRLTDLMGGSIEVSSQPGNGCEFRLVLPCAVDDPAPEPLMASLTGIRCLLSAGTDPDIAHASAYLEAAGASVGCLAAGSGSPAAVTDPRLPVVVVRHVAGPQMASVPGPAAQVLICRQPPIRPLSGVQIVSGRVLHRQELLRAVAAAAGRVVPEGLVPPKVSLTESARARPAGVEGAAPRILVAEDDGVNRQLVFQQLQLLGYRSALARDGAEALRLWRDGAYDLLLTDLHMPVMDGYALAHEIRLAEADADTGQRLPILALSADTSRDEPARSQAAGIDTYLIKPLHLERLREALEMWLGPARQQTAGGAAEKSTEVDPVFDIAVLHALVGDDAAVVQALLGEFLDATWPLAGQIRTVAAAGDLQQVQIYSHRLKSSARSVGALSLARCAESLELAAGNEDIIAVLRLAADICQALTLVEDRIRSVQAGLPETAELGSW